MTCKGALIVKCTNVSNTYKRNAPVTHTSRNYGHKVKCDCCGTETMAEIRDDKIIIIDRRHGRRHIAVLRITELQEVMQKAI